MMIMTCHNCRFVKGLVSYSGFHGFVLAVHVRISANYITLLLSSE